MQQVNRQRWKLRPNEFSPRKSIAAGVILAFFVFLALDALEAVFVQQDQFLRALHFARGFFATSGGMIIVFWIMQRKESELVALRDQFAEQLNERTQQLRAITEDNEKQRQWLEAILSSLGEGLIEIDSTGLIRRSNPRFEQLLGIVQEELIASSIEALAAKFDCLAQNEHGITIALATKMPGQYNSGEASYCRCDGKRLILSWTLSPVFTGQGAQGFVLAITDVTERRDLQAALLQQREDFLAVIRHRLRTPVLANRRTAQLFLEGGFGPVTEAQFKVLEALLESNNEIDRLLNMLIDLYRLKNASGTLVLRKQTLENIFFSVNELKAKAIERNLSFVLEIAAGVSINADSNELAKLLMHLVENAIKFARSRVIVSARVISAQEIALTVEDDGDGIAPDDLPHLFDRFYLLSARGKYSPITGIGLCLCAEIARAHNGRLECESQPGQGTKITVLLPLLEDLEKAASA